MFALGDLFVRLGSRNFDCRQDGAKLDPRLGRASYLFNATIAGIEQADAILLVGTNPRLEAAVLNASHPQALAPGRLVVGLIGEQGRPHLPCEYLGAGPQTLKDWRDGKQALPPLA
jgi:NADH-quinone oxidoreductase subunit G